MTPGDSWCRTCSLNSYSRFWWQIPCKRKAFDCNHCHEISGRPVRGVGFLFLVFIIHVSDKDCPLILSSHFSTFFGKTERWGQWWEHRYMISRASASGCIGSNMSSLISLTDRWVLRPMVCCISNAHASHKYSGRRHQAKPAIIPQSPRFARLKILRELEIYAILKRLKT